MDYYKYALDIVLLTLLQERPMYGYELRQKIIDGSDGLIIPRLSAIYPVLYRLCNNGCVGTDEQRVGRRLRVYYYITDDGRRYLAAVNDGYRQFIDGLRKLLNRPCDK